MQAHRLLFENFVDPLIVISPNIPDPNTYTPMYENSLSTSPRIFSYTLEGMLQLPTGRSRFWRIWLRMVQSRDTLLMLFHLLLSRWRRKYHR
jgi:hypothetical protein